jgi:hypothetical protein
MGQTFKFGTIKNSDVFEDVTDNTTIRNGYTVNDVAEQLVIGGTYNNTSAYFGTYPTQIGNEQTFYVELSAYGVTPIYFKDDFIYTGALHLKIFTVVCFSIFLHSGSL